MRLFNGIRKVLNVDGEAGKLSSTLTQLQLKKCIIDTKLSPQKREEIEKFVISLINSSRYEWEEASPLPINFVMIYRGLIQNFTGEYLEKVALIGLFRKMESSLNLLPDKTGDFTKLLPKYREAIEKAKLPPKAKGRIKLVLNELVSHIYSKNVDIRGGFSMTAFLSNLKKKRVAPPTKPSALRKPESDDTIEKRPRKIPESKIVTKKIEKPEVIVESRSRMKLMWVAGAVIAGAGIAVPAYLYFSDQDRKYQQAMEYMHDGDRNNLKKATKDINDNIHLDDIEHLLLQAEFNLNLAKKNRGNYEDAAGCFERILTKNPDDLEIQRRFFYAHKELGQDLQGLKSFVEMEKINSEFLNILINEYEALKKAKTIKGKVRRGRQNNRIYNNTINDLIGSLVAGEDNVEKRFEIARRYELLGRTDEAEYIYLLGASKFADYNPFAEAIARLQKK